MPARQVGGDFYDIRVQVPHVVLSLGEVMGKGMGAGMLAAAPKPRCVPQSRAQSVGREKHGALRPGDAILLVSDGVVVSDADAGVGRRRVRVCER